MKILYPMLCYFPAEVGGPANSIYWLNKCLDKFGIESYVFSTKYGQKVNLSNKSSIYTKYNIKVFFFPNSFFSFFKINKLKIIKEVDLIHFSSIFFQPTFIYILLGIIANKKIIISPRGELYPAAIARKTHIKRFYLVMLKQFQKFINFHSTNQIEYDLIMKHFPNAKSIVNIPNSIELPKKLKVKPKNQILFVGRINPIKNIDKLIEAYGKLDAKHRDIFKLNIAGEAILSYEKKYKTKLEKLISYMNLEKNVHFIGGIYAHEKQKMLAESYCLILPSQSENFGNVVLEALSQGTPAIVTSNAPWESIEKFEAGLWISPTVDRISSAMEQIIGLHEKDYSIWRENAYTLALQFDIQKNISKWHNYYYD